MDKFCQSCGIPMNKDPEGGGSNSDGSKNIEYYSFCYYKGVFMHPKMSAKEMEIVLAAHISAIKSDVVVLSSLLQKGEKTPVNIRAIVADVNFLFSLVLIPNDYVKDTERIIATLLEFNIFLKIQMLLRQDVLPIFDALSGSKDFIGLRY